MAAEVDVVVEAADAVEDIVVDIAGIIGVMTAENLTLEEAVMDGNIQQNSEYIL